MRLNIAKWLKEMGIEDTLYWGKRIVKALPQPGQFKNHSVVVNWREPEKIRIDLRAGLSGKTLAARELANYPLQLQSETFFELDVTTTATEDEGKTSGKAGDKAGDKGGARSFRHQKDEELKTGLSGSFGAAHSEEIPTHARLARGVVMGMEVAGEALDKVFDQFCQQIQQAKIMASDLLASAGKHITRYTPPPFMAPRGDEDAVYKYDRTRNEGMFGTLPT